MAHSTKRASALSALEAFIERFNAPETVLRTRILQLRLEYGAPEELCSLLQLDGIGIKQATQLHAQGVQSPSDITPAMSISACVWCTNCSVNRTAAEHHPRYEATRLVQFGQSAMCYATISNAREAHV